MSIHVPEKYIREKSLLHSPIPRNFKACQRLDEYIKELLLENKKINAVSRKNGQRDTRKTVTVLNRVMEFHGGRKIINFTK